jgi:hypothetical protein
MKKLLVKMIYDSERKRSALFMMEQDDFRVPKVEVLGTGNYVHPERVLVVDDKIYNVFSDWSVKERN